MAVKKHNATKAQMKKIAGLKPSALVRLAIKDFEKVKRMKKKYVVNMNEWHKPIDYDEVNEPIENPKVCEVCLAGSVIACSLGDGNKNLWPGVFGEDVSAALSALNDFRIGRVDAALNQLLEGKPNSFYDHDRIMQAFEDRHSAVRRRLLANDNKSVLKAQFTKDLETLAKFLASIGL